MSGSLSRCNYLLPQEGETPREQALRVFFALLQECSQDPAKKIGILFATNQIQAEIIRTAYGQPEIPEINLQNHMAFVGELRKLINQAVRDKQLETDTIRLVPFATSRTGEKTYRDRVSRQDLKRNLTLIRQYINDGYTVYGLQGKYPAFRTQEEVEEVDGYDITEGGETFFYTSLVHYCKRPGNAKNDDTQGHYVQRKLEKLPQNNSLEAQPVFNTVYQEELVFYKQHKCRANWQRLKDKLVIEAKKYHGKKEIPDDIIKALKMHYDDEHSLKGILRHFFFCTLLHQKDYTNHWKEVRQEFQL